ncbi:MAG: hypothetical protein ACLGRW_00180, partial [Acidobacteriota bacterium]
GVIGAALATAGGKGVMGAAAAEAGGNGVIGAVEAKAKLPVKTKIAAATKTTQRFLRDPKFMNLNSY